MGYQKQLLNQREDYNRLISNTLHTIDVVKECPFCHIEYLVETDEKLIYGSITNAFKEHYGEENFDSKVMRELTKQYLNERFFGHTCNKN